LQNYICHLEWSLANLEDPQSCPILNFKKSLFQTLHQKPISDPPQKKLFQTTKNFISNPKKPSFKPSKKALFHTF